MAGAPQYREANFQSTDYSGRPAGQAYIRGDGVAATCCVHLLSRAGWRLDVEQTCRPRLPGLLLSENALALIRDVFGGTHLFETAHRIRRRIVAWGPNAKPVTLNHSAVVVSEDALLEILRARSAPDLDGARAQQPSHWTIFASHPLPHAATEQAFGSRFAFAGSVTLTSTSDREACWIESLVNGWLFLISGPEGRAFLLSVGDTPANLLGRSNLVVRQIEEMIEPSSRFPAHPRIASPLCGPNWLACGSAAMAFDPICGDGTAHAVREAILAAAVIRASAAANQDIAQFLSHYESRLTAGFRRHLSMCRHFYQSGACGSWWDSELEALESGIAWCDQRLRNSDFSYRLCGFDLQRIQ